jgi:hypothetical protein
VIRNKFHVKIKNRSNHLAEFTNLSKVVGAR